MPFLEQLGSAKWTEIISEAVTDSFIVWVKMVSLSIRFQRINATRMNSLSYLPCFALLRMHLCGIRRQASQSALPPFLSPPLSLCVHWTSTNSVLLYLFVYLLLSLSISEASYQRPPNLRSRVAGELPGLHLSPYERVCVCFGIKLKYKWKGNIGIITFVIASYAVYGSHCYQTPPGWWNRKRWNVLTSWLTEYLLSNIINHWQGVLQGEWNSF